MIVLCTVIRVTVTSKKKTDKKGPGLMYTTDIHSSFADLLKCSYVLTLYLALHTWNKPRLYTTVSLTVSNIFDVKFAVEVHHGTRTTTNDSHTDRDEVARHDHGGNEDAVRERRLVVSFVEVVLVIVARKGFGVQESFEERVRVVCVVKDASSLVVTSHHYATEAAREGVAGTKREVWSLFHNFDNVVVVQCLLLTSRLCSCKTEQHVPLCCPATCI